MQLSELLDFDGWEYTDIKKGFTILYSIKEVPVSASYPAGIRYALNCIDRKTKRRIAAIDNCHMHSKFKHKRTYFDHKHKKDQVLAYQFIDAVTLLEDFQALVEFYYP